MAHRVGVMADYAKKPSDEDLAELHREAIERYRLADDYERDNRVKALEDLEFRWSDDHWTPAERKEREGRPCLTVNQMPKFIHQVTGDMRQNKPAIKVRPVEDSDKGLSDVYTGLIRHIERRSDADTAYITAADNAASCGIGHFRVNVEYAYEDSFEQDICIDRIMNPFAVLWDPVATKIDRSDASYCFVTDRVSKKEFKRRWPDATVQDFDVESREVGAFVAQDWYDKDSVRIAEYWIKKPVKKTLVELPDGSTIDRETAPDGYMVPILGPDGAPVLDEFGMPMEMPLSDYIQVAKPRTRKVDAHKICQYIISGLEVLEGPTEWAGIYIPIVPVIGEEGAVGERIVRNGMVRMAKDVQRGTNYMRSASVEVVAQQPKAPFMLTVDQIRGHEYLWENAGRKNWPFLLYNPDPRAPGAPQRTPPPMAATGLMQEAALFTDDMKSVMGIYDASLGAQSNETSGRAIMARERQGDVGTFVYIDNVSKAIAQCGRIVIDLIPKIYDTERMIRVLGEDGEEARWILNKAQQMMGPDGVIRQARVAQYMPTEEELARPGYKSPSHILMRDDAKYDIEVTTGPSFTTKRVEAADSMLQFVQAVPQAGAMVADLIAKNMDWPGSEQIAKRLKKMLPPDIDEDQPAAPPPPDPKTMASAQKDMALAEKTAAETEGVQLDNEAKKLELAAIIPAIQQAVVQAVAQGLMQALAPPPMPEQQTMMPEQPAPEAGFSFQGNGMMPPGGEQF